MLTSCKKEILRAGQKEADREFTADLLVPQEKPGPPLNGPLRPTLRDLDMQVQDYQKATQ